MNQIKKEMKYFFFAGVSAVATDLCIYYLLLSYLDASFAKAISFVLGTIVAFVLNKYYTFEKHEKSYKEIVKFCLLYTVTLFANIKSNEFFLNQLNIVFLAFLLATSISTLINFIGQKWWVFR